MNRRNVYWSRAAVCLGTWSLAAWLMPTSLLACGPYFPNTILDDPESALRAMPEANFTVEIEGLQQEMVAAGMIAKTIWPSSFFACDDPIEETLLTDLSDLKAALASGPLSAAARETATVDYEVFRVCLIQLDGLKAADVSGRMPALVPPAGLPKEFELYARGAVAYRCGDLPAARRYWTELLALHPSERRFRSTWAAFMLGRSWQNEQPTRAIDCFRLVRRLTSASFHDSLGLALSSLGWEARAELDSHRFKEAAVLYLTQSAAGDSMAMSSLRYLARELVEGLEYRMPETATDPVLQRLVTAYLVSRGETTAYDESSSFNAASDSWLEAVRQAGVGEMAGADRLAWLAYRCGKPEVAQQWLDHAPSGSITARWLAAKLMLRNGRRREAQVLLDALTREIDAAPRDRLPSFAERDEAVGDRPASRPAGELAALLMVDGRYTEAFDLLVRHGWQTDAAYVGERVLTLDELRRYVDEHLPETEVSRNPEAHAGEVGAVDGPRVDLRYLLARRLARAGELDASIRYFPSPWRAWMEDYRRRIVVGRDVTLTEATRAAALWRAARIARYLGMGLFGTEVSPDWHLYEGAFQLGYVDQRISANQVRAGLVGVDEVDRTVSQAPRIGKRFHYRFVAADLAWEAIRIMPDESTLTARILCEAGSWLKNRDPEAADRFYKALVRRCGTTELGWEARRLRWFPWSPDQDDPFPGLRGE